MNNKATFIKMDAGLVAMEGVKNSVQHCRAVMAYQPGKFSSSNLPIICAFLMFSFLL